LDTLPLLRTCAALPVDRQRSSVDVFTELRRCYTVHRAEDRRRKEDEAADKSGDLCHPSQLAAASAKQHSDRTDVESVGTLNEAILPSETLKKVGLVQRFRMMYKQYGVVLVSVHVITSSVWVGLLYFATVR